MSAYQYIIVVHGMGESKYGQTILPVISRCADVVHDVLDPDHKILKREGSPFEKEGRDIVTLGSFVSASPFKDNERPWVEFQGIPTDADEIEPFTGITTHNKEGKLIRFVEIWWSDLVDSYSPILEPASPWADGLIGRIERLDVPTPIWMPQLLFKLQDVLGPVQTVMKTRVPEVEDIAFNKYLGDVQIYAEYEPMRGIAIRRFHERMEEVYRAHLDSLPKKRGSNIPKEIIAPQFTVVAHSLGTIMSLDALMYAHFGDREAKWSATDNFPFPGYTTAKPKNEALQGGAKDSEKNPKQFSAKQASYGIAHADWIKYVKMFVTLGSPIDKFLLFWPFRYLYLNSTDWIDKSIRKKLIRHINYCDEQDPVGQSLDTLRTTTAYNEIFTASFGQDKETEEIGETKQEGMVQRVTQSLNKLMKPREQVDKNHEFDVVYKRSLWPGLAHTSYWKDKELFKNILEQVLKENAAGTPEAPNVVKDKPGKYIWIALLTYFVIPLVIITLDTVTYDMLLEPVTWKGYFFLGLVFVGTAWLSREVLNLLVWWRQLLRNKRNREVASRSTTSIFVKWIVRLGLPLLAVGFAQVALSTSSTYVQSVKNPPPPQNQTTSVQPGQQPAAGTPQTTKKDSSEILWAKLPSPVRVVLSPFLLIGGNTENSLAFWVALLSLLAMLIWYRRNFSNYKESARYEGRLSLSVDIIVFLAGYGLLLLLWQEQTDLSLIAGSIWIWHRPLGIASLLVLTAWHLFKYAKDKKAANEQEALLKEHPDLVLQKINPLLLPDYIVSYTVLFVGWMLIERSGTGLSKLFIQAFSDDLASSSRLTYFLFIGTIIWVYMAFRFYVAKSQLGADGVSSFEAYCKNIKGKEVIQEAAV